jgi:hypothetical protein
MAHYTLIARINAGGGKFPFVTVAFSKNRRPIPIEGATYYLRPSRGDKRNPIRVGKDVGLAHTTLLRMEGGTLIYSPGPLQASPQYACLADATRKTLREAARECIERSKQKSRRTYFGYRRAVNQFVATCRKQYFDEIGRDDMLDFLHELRSRAS